MENNSSKPKILAVDDTPENLDVLKGILSQDYTMLLAVNGKLAIKIAEAQNPDLILLDIMMPDMDGYAVCEHLKANIKTRDIPIIFITARSETKDETKGLLLGAVDYITKPINPAVVHARVKTHLEVKEARDYLKNQNVILEEKVAQRTRQLVQIQDVTIVALGALAETRDPETGNHIRRTQHYVKLLANKLQNHPRFASYLTREMIELLHKSAPLHDIGKVGVPDSILLKAGKLTDAEYADMKKHTTYGRNAMVSAEAVLDEELIFLSLAREIAYAHHEQWAGGGYPEGLSGDAIPISARLMAVADVYDALISRRVYKEPFSHEKAVAIIKEGYGVHFDPDVVDAFLSIADEFFTISRQYADLNIHS